MRFRVVRRTTYWDDATPPCEGVEKAVYPWKSEFWNASGNWVFWFIDINSLEELMEFFEKHGRLVIEPFESLGGVPVTDPTLEIYDDYRE